MDSPPHQSLPPVVTPNPPHPGSGQKLKKAFVPLGVLGVLLLKFKALLIPVLKFFPVLLKTGGTMFLTIWLYAQAWGWWYALGFVLLIFVHECGHLISAKRIVSRTGLYRLPPQPLQPRAHRGPGRRPDRHRALTVVVAGGNGGRRRAPVRPFQLSAAADLNHIAAAAFLLVPPADS